MTYSIDVGDHHCTPPTAGGGSQREKIMQTCSHRFVHASRIASRSPSSLLACFRLPSGVVAARAAPSSRGSKRQL
eukprot:6090571-Prymnesium_polylepis.1